MSSCHCANRRQVARTANQALVDAAVCTMLGKPVPATPASSAG